MIDANGLLKIIDDKSKQPKTIFFGTISGDLRVIFDGEVAPTQKQMACINYTPVADDRVAIYKQGQIYTILGQIGDSRGSGALTQMDSINISDTSLVITYVDATTTSYVLTKDTSGRVTNLHDNDTGDDLSITYS